MTESRDDMKEVDDGLCRPLSRSEQKQQAIIQAAHQAFLEKGFDAVSMDHIAELAQVSKRTVYNHYDSKEILFASVIGHICGTNRVKMFAAVECNAPIETTLNHVGTIFLRMLFNPQNISMYRILAAQSDKFPEVGKAFFDSGPRPTLHFLADYLSKQADAGIIDLNGDDPYDVAGAFMSALHGKHHTECLLTGRRPPDEAEIERMVEQTVRRFLKGVLPR